VDGEQVEVVNLEQRKRFGKLALELLAIRRRANLGLQNETITPVARQGRP